MLMFNADELFERLGLTVNCEDCKHHNKDYISKCDNSTWMEVCDILDYMTPIDAVPVVRCKDCVHGTDRAEEFGDGCVNPIACMMYSSDGEPDFFPKDNYCGFGERRDDDTD